MFTSSEDALACRSTLSLDRATAELRRHYCRVLDHTISQSGVRLLVTNDLDPAEWIDSTPRAILTWLGY